MAAAPGFGCARPETVRRERAAPGLFLARPPGAARIPKGMAEAPRHEPEDAELIRRVVASDDAGAFAALYRRHAGPVYAFLRGLSPGDEHAAKDALQETFLRGHGALERFQRGRPLRPWLLRIARNVSLDARKRRSAGEQPRGPEAIDLLAGAAEAPGPPEEAARREVRGLLRGVVSRLPEEQRAVFLLKHDRGLTFSEAAAALGCSVRTAKYRMRAALELIGREAERLGVEA